MHLFPRSALSASLALLVAGTASAQQQQVIPIHTAPNDQGTPYGIWAAGADYKVSFHDGMTFVPLLGSDYPRNQPVHWRTTSVAIGDTELVTHAPRLTYRARRAEYDLGAVVEAYDVRSTEIEQTFVIARRPQGQGDLVVTGRLTSDLFTDRTAAAHQPLTLRDHNGLDLVRYGAAVAVDANGARRAMSTAHDDGVVTLRLDAAWLENARYPIVVDPILTSTGNVLGADREEVDCVRDTQFSGVVWDAVTIWASAIDRDVICYRWTDSDPINSLGAYYSDLTSSWSALHARVAFSPGNGHCAMVFNRYFPSSQTSRLRYHLHAAAAPVFNSTVQAIVTSDNAWRPDVGGSASGAAGNQVLVVWQQEENNGPFVTTTGSNIYGCNINTAINSASAPFDIDVSPLRDSERPNVNQVRNGSPNEPWMVAYQRRTNFLPSFAWGVAVRAVRNFLDVSASMTIDPASTQHQLAPHVSGADGRYLVAYTGSDPGQVSGVPAGINGHQLHATRLDWQAGAGAGTQPWPSQVLQTSSNASWQVGGVAHDRNTESHWLITFRSSVTGWLSMRTVGYRGQSLQFENIKAPAPGNSLTRCAATFHPFTNQYHLMFAENGNVSLGFSATLHYRFEYPSVTPTSTTGSNCSPASIQWLGSQLVGSEFGRARVSGAAFDSLHVMALAAAPSSVPLSAVPLFAPNCTLLVATTGPGFLGTYPLAIGSAADFELPLPEWLGTNTYYFQDFHTVGNGNLDLVATDRLALPIVK